MPAREAPRTWSSPSASPKSTARRSTASPSSRRSCRRAGSRPLEDYIDVAAFLLAVEREAIVRLPWLVLAESALPAPFASFGRVEAHPTLPEQAAVLLAHLADNHPLPDANKRAAFLLTARFLDANGLTWRAPDVEIDTGIVERIAAGEAAHDEIVDCIRERTRKEGDEPRAAS